MTRKDYVKLAGALAKARIEARAFEGSAGEFVVGLAEVRIARILADDNPNFDRHRFHMAAIGQPVTGRDRTPDLGVGPVAGEMMRYADDS